MPRIKEIFEGGVQNRSLFGGLRHPKVYPQICEFANNPLLPHELMNTKNCVVYGASLVPRMRNFLVGD